jgi:hypothetical protein
MKPIVFEEQNRTFVAQGCEELPAYQDDHQIISCWEMTFEDKIHALFFGKIWLAVVGDAHPPVWLAATRTVFISDPDNADEELLAKMGKYRDRKIAQFIKQHYGDEAMELNLLVQSLADFFDWMVVDANSELGLDSKQMSTKS